MGALTETFLRIRSKGVKHHVNPLSPSEIPNT
nr:MAG TPA: hypothetical protein [Caudoviricetes sp.]